MTSPPSDPLDEFLSPMRKGVSIVLGLHGWRGIGAWQDRGASEVRLGFFSLMLAASLFSERWHRANQAMKEALRQIQRLKTINDEASQ